MVRFEVKVLSGEAWFSIHGYNNNFQALMDHVNSIHPSIQFSMEKEQDNKLLQVPFIIGRLVGFNGISIFVGYLTLIRYIANNSV